MALRAEAPSTGSRREPSRLEQNTNQRLTGHSHSPHRRRRRTPVRALPPTLRDLQLPPKLGQDWHAERQWQAFLFAFPSKKCAGVSDRGGAKTWSRTRLDWSAAARPCKCLKISEQSAKILITTVLVTQASHQGRGRGYIIP